MNHREWLEEAHNRQRNIAPQDTIRNDALVEKLLIRGDKRLTRVQRIGAILFSLLWFGVGGIAWFATFDLAHGMDSDPILAIAVLFIALIAAAFTYIAFRMVWNGMTGGRKVHRRP